jgi:hypothetical protein
VNQPGEDTQNLRPRPAIDSDADKAEIRTQQVGRRMLIAGIVGIPMPFLFCLGAAVATDNNWGNPGAQLFAVLGVVVLALSFLGLLLAGAAEHRQRPLRTRQRENAGAVDRNRILIERMALDHSERLDHIMGLIAPLPGRLNDVDQRLDEMAAAIKAVPDYGRGVEDGVRASIDALGPDRP